ncbi:MAG: hypothetical protein K2X93_18645 [Candidatus Obscuribacterales bacterium]|nr:hypothetical protein [Candidatus Obscuribacterales bacterium]
MYYEAQSEKFGADLERVQVWDSLSEFYLDTYHTEEELQRMGEFLSSTRFSIEEMRHIALFEVTPVCLSNLFCMPGGEWAGFALDWLIPKCMVQQQKHPFSADESSNNPPIGIRLLAPFCKECYSMVDRIDRIRKSATQNGESKIV